MTWNEERSQKRIIQHLDTVPVFDEQITLSEHSRIRLEARKAGQLDRLSARRAFVVEGAHLYGQLLDFGKLVSEHDGLESEATHNQLLQFLNMHYSLWDAVVDHEEAERIDYHGARLHSLVSDAENPRAQVERAVALAAKLTELSKRIAEVNDFPARIRFGIDQGKCLAMTTGRAHEKDTLFMGAPANHAAKIATEHDLEGIFLSKRAQELFDRDELVMGVENRAGPARALMEAAIAKNQFSRLDIAAEQLIQRQFRSVSFSFHRVRPPLSSIKFSELRPSNSVRMGMASLFADINGFTKFVDGAIAKGSNAIKEAATNIHVIREELNAVLKDDFDGKRVRFIGDCIHGVIATGDQRDKARETVTNSALCAAGMRSSFDLCQGILNGIDELDLAVGIEYGPTPLTRLGEQGEQSVRCASCCAAIVSEEMQQSLDNGGIVLGPTAEKLATSEVRQHFSRAISIMEYDDAATLLGSPVSPAVRIVSEDSSARPYMKG